MDGTYLLTGIDGEAEETLSLAHVATAQVPMLYLDSRDRREPALFLGRLRWVLLTATQSKMMHVKSIVAPVVTLINKLSLNRFLDKSSIKGSA